MSWFQVLKKDMSYCICSGPNKTKGFTCKQHCKYGRVKKEEPRKGTGKKPKGSSRRLYTDENPDDTVPENFAQPKMLEIPSLVLRSSQSHINGNHKSSIW